MSAPHSEQHLHDHDHLHDHAHGHDHDHEHPTGLRGVVEGIFRPHSHDHGELAADTAFANNQLGIRTVWLALVALAVTSIIQLIIVAASGSVALLGDTVHNIGDGLNSIPLLIAFYLARRVATARFTYGYGRAEDVAGVFIVLSIIFSAGVVFWESFQRLLDPQPMTAIGWVVAAAVVGFVGNELVALMQIRVGKQIGSEALIADGLHARTDGLTSLAVLPAAGGALLGFPLVDPIIGILMGIVILFITWDAAKRIGLRLMDGVDPALTARVEQVVLAVPGVLAVDRLRLRWLGHQLQADARLLVDPAGDAALVKAELRHQLGHHVPELAEITIETTKRQEAARE